MTRAPEPGSTGPHEPAAEDAAARRAPVDEAPAEPVAARYGDEGHDPGPAASSTARYVVGYAGDKRSKDAVRLAVALAHAFGARLEIVCVLRGDDPFAQVYPPVGDISPVLRREATRWLREADALVAGRVPAATHVRSSPSVVGGLLDAVAEFDAALLVVGAAHGAAKARLRVGPVADSLLHSAPVPVALAPRGYRGTEPITRLYAGVGARPGGQHVIERAVRAVSRSGAQLVLLNLLPLDRVRGESAAAIAAAETLVRDAARRFGAEHASVHVATGTSFAAAVKGMDWAPGSVLFVGSSRLAGPRQLFLGTTAARVLRHVPVPFIVLPRADDAAWHPRGPGAGAPDGQVGAVGEAASGVVGRDGNNRDHEGNRS